MMMRWTWLLLGLAACPAPVPDTGHSLPAPPQRIISLSPGITETIATLGAAANLVAVSDYCRRPAEVCARPRVGHALRPDLEAIAKFNPDLIIYETTETGPGADLSVLAPIETLPWLTLADITASIRRLGRRLDRADAAETWANRLEAKLGRTPDPQGPEVLIMIGYPEASGTFWFIKPKSLHGHLVTAAGGRHPAKLLDWKGPPKMSAEDLVRLDPEWIVVLGRDDRVSAIDSLRRMTPLQAVRNDHLRQLVGPYSLSTGPTILDQVDLLAKKLQETPAP